MDWSAKSDPSEIEQELRDALSDDATPGDVHAFARSNGLECSDLVDDVIHCSAPARSRMRFVAGKWLLRFVFEDDRLQRIEVQKGLTGP